MIHRSESELNFDNIVFANRNQSYGAYDLRNIYNSHLKTAILIAAIFFSGALISPKIIKMFGGVEKAKEEYKITKLVLEPPPIEPEKPELLPPVVEVPKIASTRFVEPEILEDEEVVHEEEPPTQTEMQNSNPGEIDQEGVTTFAAPVNEEVEEVEAPEILVTEKSTFQGDYFRFLSNNISYPDAAKKAMTQGKVHIQFIIEKDGKVSDVKVLKGLSNGLNEEAIRVIQLTSGKWSVAKKNGVPVRYKTSLAVEFKLVQQ